MTKTAIIGLGYWGKILYSKLKILDSQCLVIEKDKDLKEYNLENIDWVFIATPNETHYELVKKFLNLHVNVFCEKPLTSSIKRAEYLYNIAQSKKLLLYVSDIENYKNHKIKIKKDNFILRKKISSNKKDILDRLAYHDFTYLYKFNYNKKIKKINVVESKIGSLSFQIVFQDEKYNFEYSLNANDKCHLFNNSDLTSSRDALLRMINSVLEKKVDFNLNRNIALFSSEIVQRVKKELNRFEKNLNL